MNKKESKKNEDQNDDFLTIIGGAIALEEPDRVNRFETLIKNAKNTDERDNLTLILNRIKILGLHIDGFLPEEIIKFQNEIIGDFYHKLTNTYFIEYLRYEKRRLEGLTTAIKTEMDSLPMYTYGPVNRYAQLFPWYQHNSRLNEWLGEVIIRFSKEKSFLLKIQEKKIKVTNEMVAGFCNLVNSSVLSHPQIEGESAETYCRRICELYNLPYKTRVRISYLQPVKAAIAEKIRKAILPTIPTPDQEAVLKVISSLSKGK